jgi:hypothetical protein
MCLRYLRDKFVPWFYRILRSIIDIYRAGAREEALNGSRPQVVEFQLHEAASVVVLLGDANFGVFQSGVQRFDQGLGRCSSFRICRNDSGLALSLFASTN